MNLKIHFFTNVSFLTLLFCLQEQDYYWSELACLLAEFPLTATTLPYRVLGNFLTLKKQRPLQGALSSGYLLSGLQSLGRDAIFNQFSFLNPRRNISFFFYFFEYALVTLVFSKETKLEKSNLLPSTLSIWHKLP